jgi:hypothetical protein
MALFSPQCSASSPILAGNLDLNVTNEFLLEVYTVARSKDGLEIRQNVSKWG